MAKGFGLIGLMAALCLGGTAAAQDKPHWVGAWQAAQLVPSGDAVVPSEDLTDATLRQVVRVTLGGKRLRVRFSNAFGSQPLTIDAASVARASGGSRIDGATLRRLTFAGKQRATIPAGADYLSDPVTLPLTAGADLAISIHLPSAPDRHTGHPGSRATSYFVHGNQVAAGELSGAKTAPRWLVIGGVEVDAASGSAVVVLGDSITDGYGVETDSDQRWPDLLASRMRADPATRGMAVLNAGIGGNRLRLDGLGPNALARFERDVLGVPGVSHLIVLEGVNDLGTLTRDAPATPEQHAALVEEMIGALQQIVARARAHGIKAIGGTIMPYGGSAYYHPDALNEADRQAVNAWIRTPGNFDGVIDFDAALRDPARPTYLRKEFDNDGLHPSAAGYRAMADAVPLWLLAPGAKGRAKPAPAAALENGPAIAITFDDLPAHAALPPGVTREQLTRDIVAALAAAHAPATGFINGARIDEEPGSAAVLDIWRQAGLPLGNHGWRHANLSGLGDAEILEEVRRNEPILQARMGSSDWHWFRYPFLAEGQGERRAAIRRLLAARGYKVATVTMGFSDWAYNDTYARCVAKSDGAAIQRMEAAWLAGAEAEGDRSRAMAKALYGRDIPYVLLMHIGAFDARLMPKLLAMYRAKGFRFVTLEAAERDPHYRGEIDPSLPPPPQGLEGALAAKGLPVPLGPSLLPFDTMCR
jgi:lysophospholipase L1-like esterase